MVLKLIKRRKYLTGKVKLRLLFFFVVLYDISYTCCLSRFLFFLRIREIADHESSYLRHTSWFGMLYRVMNSSNTRERVGRAGKRRNFPKLREHLIGSQVPPHF